MGFSDSSVFMKVNVLLLFGAIVLDIFGIALPYWVYDNTGVLKVYYGLWKRCTEVGDSGSCANHNGDFVGDWIKTVRGVEMAGMALVVCALVCTLIVVFLISDKKKKKKIKLLAWMLSLFAVGFIFIGVIIFAGQSEETGYSGAFAITIVAGIVTLVAAVAGLLDWALIQLYLK